MPSKCFFKFEGILAQWEKNHFVTLFMKKIVLLFLLIFANISFSQDTIPMPDDTRWDLVKYDVVTIFKGMGYSYARPFHWQGKQWAQFGGVVAGTALVYTTDYETSTFVRANRESVPNWVRDYGSFYGSPQNNFLATTGVYLVGLFTKNEKLRRTGVLLVGRPISKIRK